MPASPPARVPHPATIAARAEAIRARTLVPLPPSPLPDMLYTAIDGTGVPMAAAETEDRPGKTDRPNLPDDGRARTREVKLACLFTQTTLDEDGRPGPRPRQVLELRSSSTTHRPVVDGLELIVRYANAGNLSSYPAGERVAEHPGLAGDWDALVYRADQRGRRRVVRMTYEVCTFRALRDRLRCKEIWVVGADRWRNPDEDLPADFDDRRTEHYAQLLKPLDAARFADQLREEMRAELDSLHADLPRLPWLAIADRSAGAIKLTGLDAAPEPRNLRRLKAEVARHWARCR
jgi:hypothetical protein